MSGFRKALPAIATLLIFCFYFLLFEGVAFDYWDTYIAAPATFIAGEPCRFVDGEGNQAYEYHLKDRLPDDLIDKQSYGTVSKDQRIGAGVTFSVAYLVFGVAGFRLLYALFGALAFAFSYLAGRRLFDGQLLPIALGLIVSVNPFMLSMNRLNANFITVSIMAGLLALLLEEKPRWWAVGLVYGALGGIRNEAIMMVPALCVLFFTAKASLKGLPGFTVGAVLGISPYLIWNKFAFGKALIHASQYSDFDGWRPSFPHSIFGWEFEFNGLFNWPFHDHLVRTPHYPFPTYLTLPLVIVLCFGVILIAFGLLGLFAQWHKDKRIWGFLVLWIALCLGLFLFQENWEEPKTTFGALNIVPLAVLMSAGIAWLKEGLRSPKRWIALLVAVLLIEGGLYAVRGLEVPVDERWYVRFPKAKVEAAQTGCLNDLQRREWMFFHTDECQEELDEQRAKLTRGNLLPGLYYPLEFYPENIGSEWWRYRPDIFDIWHQIYGL